MIPSWFKLLAGADVYARLDAEKEARVPKSSIPGRADCYDSRALSILHSDQRLRGFRGVELVKSGYGWSVRDDSGFSAFALMYSSCCGDGSFDAAFQYAESWASEDPERRYVWTRDASLISRNYNVGGQ